MFVCTSFQSPHKRTTKTTIVKNRRLTALYIVLLHCTSSYCTVLTTNVHDVEPIVFSFPRQSALLSKDKTDNEVFQVVYSTAYMQNRKLMFLLSIFVCENWQSKFSWMLWVLVLFFSKYCHGWDWPVSLNFPWAIAFYRIHVLLGTITWASNAFLYQD